MAFMPRGEPQSVPDPDGDAYDEMLRRYRLQQAQGADVAGDVIAASEGDDQLEGGAGVDHLLPTWPIPQMEGAIRDYMAKDANGQPVHPVGHAGPIGSLVPLYPGIRNGLADAQVGDWGAVGGDAASVAFDGASLALGGGAAEAAAKGLPWKTGKVSANAANRMVRRKLGLAGTEAGLNKEVHHVFGLKGISRNAENWRNQFPLLKVMEKGQHRRMTGRWDGLPKFNPLQRAWYGTPTWMKAAPAVPAALGDHIVGGMSAQPNTPAPPLSPPVSPSGLDLYNNTYIW
jgi:hypothetical protein